ncbi:MAG: CBS domain-containing protein [Rhodospirillales bacterium]|nr:CBS domain-containing protein [Rhodospirillales bacterium]MDH3792403.1 CBS domain-containing protein [Rhodospirillales bacterium]
MKVLDMLSKKGNEVATIRPDATINTAVRRLKLEGIGALVVSADDSGIDGIISERDIVRGLPEHGADLLSMKVSELMTSSVKTCSPDDKIQDIMSEMTRRRFRHMPVISDGKLCGIISIGDVVKNRLEELQTETHVLRDYIVGRS